MGYTTDFKGSLQFDKPLTASQIAYIQAFNNTRRMKRKADYAEVLKDDLRTAVGLPIGEEGAYYVGSHSDGQMGQKNDASILDYNTPSGQLTYDEGGSDRYEINKQRIKDGLCQPGLWCQWTVTDDGTELEWDGGEKFYYYTEWLQYLITHFFNVWGVKLNGKIKWQGEDMDDRGEIIVTDSEIETLDYDKLKADNAALVSALDGFIHNWEALGKLDDYNNVATNAKSLINTIEGK